MNNYKVIDETSNQCLVSVVMLAYNHAKFISEAIESFLSQKTYFPIKLIIAEDFSTDNTREIIINYQKKYPKKIKLILQNENVGAKKNNIDLFENLEGKYIAALEGDDYWIDPLKLQKQVDFLEENEDYQMVFSQCLEIGDVNNLKRIIDCDRREYFDIELMNQWLVPTASVLFRNNLSEKDYKILNHKDVFFSDIFLFLIQFNKGRVFGFDEKLSVYRINEGSVTNTRKTIVYFEKLYNHFIYMSMIYNKKYNKHLVNKVNYLGKFIIKYYIKRMNIKSFYYSFELLKYHLNK